jgi:hypothetical protein
MNTDFSIPPLRDLPPGRLALRTQHLRSAISDERRLRGLPFRIAPRVRLMPALVIVAALAALALVPIGGASLASRAIDGMSGVWRSGLPLEAQQGQPYQPGDKVWTTEPPHDGIGDRVAITIPCPNGTDDAARKLFELDHTFGAGRSPVSDVNCAPGSIPKTAIPPEVEFMSSHLPPYQPGDKVWTTEPPNHGMGDRVAITIACPNGTIDAARKLAELGREGSPVNEIDCR